MKRRLTKRGSVCYALLALQVWSVRMLVVLGSVECVLFLSPHAGSVSWPDVVQGQKTTLCLFLQYSFLILSLFVRDTFVLRLIHTCIRSVFWLFWLSCQYFSSDWLERLLWGSLTMVRELSPQCPGWRVFMIFLSHIIVSLLYDVCILSPALRDIFHTPVAWYSLAVLKVPLNTNQLTTVTIYCGSCGHHVRIQALSSDAVWLCLLTSFYIHLSRTVYLKLQFAETSLR